MPGNEGRRAPRLIVYLNGSSQGSALGDHGWFGWKAVTHAYYVRKHFSSGFDVMVPEYLNVEPGSSRRGDLSVLEHYTLDERVQTAAAAIDDLLRKEDYASVFIIGHSEGALILAKVYRALAARERVTKLVFLSYGGMSQFESFAMLYEKFHDRQQGYIQALKNLDGAVKDIASHPASLEKWWLGWPYRRWSSFGPYHPMSDIELISIPMLFVHGEKDIQAPIESSRLVARAFRDAGRSNLSYIEYAGCGHDYNGDHAAVLADVEKWLTGALPPRQVNQVERRPDR